MGIIPGRKGRKNKGAQCSVITAGGADRSPLAVALASLGSVEGGLGM